MAFAPASLQRDYGDVRSEVLACRTRCALFDFSFLERASIAGSSAQHVLEAFTGRSLAKLQIGEVRYALRVGSTGVLLADLTIWRTGPGKLRADERAARGRERSVAPERIGLSRRGSERADGGVGGARAAIPGRAARARGLSAVATLRYFEFCEARLAGVPCLIGRLGYSGEPGFEIIVNVERRPHYGTNSASGHGPPALQLQTSCASRPVSCCLRTSSWSR